MVLNRQGFQYITIHNLPLYLICPDLLSLVGELISVYGWGFIDSFMVLASFFFNYSFIYSFILGVKGLLLSS